MTAFIHFENVSKAFHQKVRVVDDLNLEVDKGEFLCLLGPSGSGKTTTLMMLAGFESVSAGTIRLDGQRINDIAPHKRGMGVVFQNYALFPHMSVAGNVAFPLQMRRLGRAETERRVLEALERVKLAHLGDRKPDQLSGGQQQRVALARALVFEPSVILMDEPLGALDKQLREEMQLEIRDLHRRLGLTIVFVTHDQAEALTMSDRIAVFDKGKIAQVDTPANVYDRPQNRFVAQFVGETNLLQGRLAGRNDDGAVVELAPGLTVEAAVPERGLPGQGGVVVSIRPERIRLGEAGTKSGLPATIDDVVYQGNHTRLQVTSGPLAFVVRCERGGRDWRIGEAATLSFDPRDCAVFEA